MKQKNRNFLFNIVTFYELIIKLFIHFITFPKKGNNTMHVIFNPAILCVQAGLLTGTLSGGGEGARAAHRPRQN